jgi:hypothetical protein
MEPETCYARSGGLRIAYQVTGEGPDLVMVPGLTSHLDIQWRNPGYRRFVRSLSSFCRRTVHETCLRLSARSRSGSPNP